MGGSSTRSEFWAIRVTTDKEIDWLSHVWENSKREFKTCFRAHVVEVGKKSGNRHYHLAVAFSEEVTHNQMVPLLEDVKEKYGLGPLSCQKKVWDGEERYIQYINKENDVVYQGELNFKIKKAEEYRDLFKLESSGLKRIMKGEIVKDVSDEVREIISKWSRCDQNNITKIRAEVVNKYMDFYSKNKLNHPSDFVVKVHLKNIMLKLNNKVALISVANKYMEFF